MSRDFEAQARGFAESSQKYYVALQAAKKLLASGRCSEPACLMGTITGKKIGPGLWDQRKCQWCAERKDLLAGAG